MKALKLIVAGVVMFAASAGASWYYRSLTQPPAEVHNEESAADGHDPDEHMDVAASGSTPPEHGESSDHGDHASQGDHEPLPVAVRPRPMSVEEMVRHSLELKKREESLHEREEALAKDVERHKLVMADIQVDQQETNALLASVEGQRNAAFQLLQKLEESRASFDAQQKAEEERKQQEDAARVSIEAEHEENVKHLATWLQAMEPEKAAEVLKEFAQEGKMETAVQILSKFEERDAAQILSSIEDSKLISQFVEAFRNMKRPPKPTSQR